MDEKDDPKALDQLYWTAGRASSGRDLEELFAFIRQLPGLGPYNAGLVHAQRPGSDYVATETTWARKFGRRLKPGVRPLVVLRPFGPDGFGVDVAGLVCGRIGISISAGRYLSGYRREGQDLRFRLMPS